MLERFLQAAPRREARIAEVLRSINRLFPRENPPHTSLPVSIASFPAMVLQRYDPAVPPMLGLFLESDHRRRYDRVAEAVRRVDEVFQRGGSDVVVIAGVDGEDVDDVHAV